MFNGCPENETVTYVYFSIGSNGEIINGKGLIANDSGIFDPDIITDMLGVKPRKSWKAGDARIGGTIYGFSAWLSEQSSINQYDIEQQCLDIVSQFRDKVDILKQIKKLYDVQFNIMIVPHIYETTPVFNVTKEVIEFCYLTGTEIVADIYNYAVED